MTIKTIKDLMPDSHNANKGTVRGAKMIEASLQQDGFGRPVLVDKNGQLIAGNKTVQGVADTFGIDTEVVLVKTTGNKVIVHQREDLDLESDDLNNPARRLAYRDNLAGHFSFELSPEVVLADFEGGFDFDDIGVKVEDLAVLLPDVTEFGENGDGGQDTEAQIDKAEELRKKWGVELGQLWQLGRHRIACADSTDKEAVKVLVGAENILMVWADPPYGIELDTDYSKLKGTSKSPNAKGYSYPSVIGDEKPFDFGSFPHIDCKEQFWWGADYYANQLPLGGSWLVWLKRNESDTEMIGNDFELCWSKTKHKRAGVRIRWVGWDATEVNEKRAHPTQKPVALFKWCVEKYLKDGGIIFDPFLGSGISVIGAEELGENYTVVGCELAPEYIATTIQRWADHTGKTPVLIES